MPQRTPVSAQWLGSSSGGDDDTATLRLWCEPGGELRDGEAVQKPGDEGAVDAAHDLTLTLRESVERAVPLHDPGIDGRRLEAHTAKDFDHDSFGALRAEPTEPS